MLKYNDFLNESNSDNEYNWYLGIGKFNDLDFTNWICKKENSEKYLYKSEYSFIMGYSPTLYETEFYRNCWISPPERLKKINQVKFSSCQYGTESLMEIFDISCISDEFVDFLDFGSTNEMISFLPKNKIHLVDDPYNNKYRQEMKFGRFFNRHTILDINDIGKKPIELLSNIYKSICESILNPTDIEIVEGEEIRYWYDEKNYVEGNSNLQKSCMRYSTFSKRFDIYVENPEICKLLIIKNESNKLLGRALLWKTNKGYYMDRVYTAIDHIYYQFIGYAEKNNYMTYNRKKEYNLYVDIKNDYTGVKNPYMDTFKFYEYNENRLYNNRPPSYEYALLDDFN